MTDHSIKGKTVIIAGGDNDIIFLGIVQRRGFAAEADEAIGLARHGGDDDGDGAGEIERADVLGLDGDAADGIGVRGQQVVGQSLGLAAEVQRVAGAVFDLRVGPGTAGAVEE